MAVAHHPAGEQGVGRQRGDPVADLVRRDPVSGAGDLLQHARVPPHVEGVDDDPDLGGRELLGDVQRLTEGGDHTAVGGVDRVHRLDAEPDPALSGVGTRSAAIASTARARAPGKVAVAVGQAARHQHRVAAPSAAASSMARRFSSCASLRALSSEAVKKPPRQSVDTRRPASASQRRRGRRARPRRPARARPRSSRARRRRIRRSPRAASRSAVVRWFSDSRARRGSSGAGVATRCGNPEGTSLIGPRLRPGATAASGRKPGPGPEQAGLVGELEDPAEVDGAAGGLQPADHREAVLVAVQPGQEGDPGLVVERGRLEDVPGQRQRRRHLRVVRRQVVVVQGGQRGRRRGSDGRERSEQRVGVMGAVATDQLGVVEVVAGVEADAVRQPARRPVSCSADSSDTLTPSTLAACSRTSSRKVFVAGSTSALPQ